MAEEKEVNKKQETPKKKTTKKNNTTTQKTASKPKTTKTNASKKPSNQLNGKENPTEKKSTPKKQSSPKEKTETKKKKDVDQKPKNPVKQAKKDDEKIKQIILEQINNITELAKEKNNLEVPNKSKRKKKVNKFNPAEIEKKIQQKMKMPKEQKNVVYKQMLTNILLAIALVIYCIFVNLGALHIKDDIFVTDLKVFSLSFITIAIIIFESAYNRDKGELAIYGVEILITAITTLMLTYLYMLKMHYFIQIVAVLTIMVVTYYIIKILIINYREKLKYINSVSDVKEIMDENEE